MNPELSLAVSAARAAGRPVVCLESTIFSELGLPSPANREALVRCCAAIESAGAEAAVTAVLDGRLRLGIDGAEGDVICGPARKVAARDLAVAVAQGWRYGATTVSAALALAARAGVQVFATGGIGGVHRGARDTGDISADLDALAAHPVVTVSSGAKAFLDLPRTFEHLETASVPVLGWRCDELPAFWSRSSGLPVTHRVESADEVARIARVHWHLGGGGLLVVAPIPAAAALPAEELDEAIAHALERADAADQRGAGVTPKVLATLAEVTGDRTVEANLALAEHNAAVAAEVAGALASLDAA
jgi:pseudouridylate synthase